MRVCAVTTVWNEAERLPAWLRHYGREFGRENLFVIDDGSDDGSTSDLAPVNVVRRPRETYDDRTRVVMISDFVASLLERYDTVVFSDADELIAPFDGGSLRRALSATDLPTITVIGLDVIQYPGVEGPLEPDLPVMAQRRYARVNPTYCKPLVTRQPIRWRPGLHFSDRPIAFADLLLFHTRHADLDQGLRRLRQNQRLEIAGLDQGFATHWKADGTALRAVIEEAGRARYGELDRPAVAAWEALLSAKLHGNPPNAVARIRHLWDEHPSWFHVPERFRHVG